MEKSSTWMRGAERLLETLPGVLSASLESDTDHTFEVRLLVDEDPPVSETLDAVRSVLEGDADTCPLGACFRIRVASVGDESPHRQHKTQQGPGPAARGAPAYSPIRLITHHVRDVNPRIVGVELTLGFGDGRFAGVASGQAESPGRIRIPALATLNALASYTQSVFKGVGAPTLALESVCEWSLSGSRVAVVVVTMSEHKAPLIASWPSASACDRAVILATLEATARRVTRSSTAGVRQPSSARRAAGLVGRSGVAGLGAGVRQQAESLLESANAIASARIVLDDVHGFRIHVLATAEMPSWEVSQTVMTLLDECLGLRVHSDQIAVSQSRLSREELKRLLGRRSSSRSAAETGSVGPSGNHPRPSAGAVSRFSLVDLSIVAHGEDRHEVGVRISGGPNSADGRCQASGGGVELLQPLAEATVDAVRQLLGRYGRKVALKLKGVHRFGKRLGEGVVVLVEATADGRKELLSGAAFAADSFERAAVVASLQATNTLVAGVLGLPHAHEDQLEAEAGHSGQAVSKTAHAPLPPNASAATLNPSPDKPSSSSKTISMPSAPDEYVSEVLSRIRSSGELDQASPPS